MGDWVAQQQQLQQLLADLADDDPRLAALRNLRDQREKEAAEAAQILNNTVREHPRLRQFDHQAVDQLPLEYLPSAQD
jgi:LmbE family N-acetylglucosaminyl deacetylase